MDRQVRDQLAPTGVLRAGINLSNQLLVSGRNASGDPVGVSPGMARAVAEELDVPVRYVTYPRPSELADAAGAGAWDIGLIGAEPQRAETIAFTAAYAEIEATYLVPAGSRIAGIDEVDRPGIRIVFTGGSAYGLWLDRNIRHATLVRSKTLDEALERFQAEGLEVMAGIRPRLLMDTAAVSGSRLLDGRFMSVQQAVGVARANQAAAEFLQGFVQRAKSSGLVRRLIEQHGIRGLTVARP